MSCSTASGAPWPACWAGRATPPIAAICRCWSSRSLAPRYRDWYPPEVRKQQAAAPATDLFLAARCLVYLAGGDPVRDRMPDTVPAPLRRFVRACLLEGVGMRPDDIWKLQDEF